jgi:hypothetical protein
MKATQLIIVILAIYMLPVFLYASVTDGTVTNPSYAWGDNLGWINLGCSTCNVHVKDTTITGYAWSKYDGWINFAPSRGGTTNTCSGQLGGTAWSEKRGWISMDGVTIDTSGKFVGTAGTALNNAGRINFSCSMCEVKTDWKQCSLRTIAPSITGSGGGGSAAIGKSLTATILEQIDALHEQILKLSPQLNTQEQVKVAQAAPQKTDTTRPEYIMWFYEIVQQIDLYRDGKIDIYDYNTLMRDWGKKNTVAVVIGINVNTKVGLFDFNLLMKHWGKKEKNNI